MAASHHDETERKYDVGSRAVLPDLVAAEGVAAVDPPAVFELEATYFDTPHHHLARKGITLRRRTGGSDDGWHLKLPVGADTRTEVRGPLGGNAGEVPEQLKARVRAVAHLRPLSPVATLSTYRREYALRDTDGAILAYVCDDTVRARLPGGNGPEPVWREWEVELAAGTASVLDAVAEVPISAGASVSTSRSKLERVLGEAARSGSKRPASKHRATGTVGEVLTAHLAEHTARLREHEAGLRTGQPESVHRLRIEARQLRAALSTFRPVLDRKRTDPVQEELRWLGQALAPARDAQVLREHLLQRVSAEPAALVVGSAATRIDEQLSADHRQGLQRARAALDSERYDRLLGTLDCLVSTPPLKTSADRPAQKVLPRLLRRDLERVALAVRAIDLAVDDDTRDTAFHEARKKAKRLRYGAELAVPPLGKRARSLASSTKKVQQVLGEHQDSVAARRRLSELGLQAHLAGENAFTLGRLHALEQARAARVEADFARVWAAFTRKQGRRWGTSTNGQ